MSNTGLFKKVSKRWVAFVIEDHDVIGVNRDGVADGYRKIPESLTVESVSGIKSRELTKVVSDRELRIECELVGKWLSGVIEVGECLAELFFSGGSFFGCGGFVEGAIDAGAD